LTFYGDVFDVSFFNDERNSGTGQAPTNAKDVREDWWNSS
jgi:hypothetical protein